MRQIILVSTVGFSIAVTVSVIIMALASLRVDLVFGGIALLAATVIAMEVI